VFKNEIGYFTVPNNVEGELNMDVGDKVGIDLIG
jgi:hypothetical protein